MDKLTLKNTFIFLEKNLHLVVENKLSITLTGRKRIHLNFNTLHFNVFQRKPTKVKKKR